MLGPGVYPTEGNTFTTQTFRNRFIDIKLFAATPCVFVHVEFFLFLIFNIFSDDLSPREAAKRQTNMFRSFLSWPLLTALEQRPEQEKQRLIDQLFLSYEEELVHNVNAAPKEDHHAHIWIQKIQVQWS